MWKRLLTLVFGFPLLISLAGYGARAEESVADACLASATRIAKAVGGAVAQQAFGDVYLQIPNVATAHYGCAKGNGGLYVTGAGKNMSASIAKILGVAAKSIAGRDDPALDQGGPACMKTAEFVPVFRRSGKATQRAMEAHKKMGGEISVGEIVFRCEYYTDAYTDPEFFVGPRPSTN